MSINSEGGYEVSLVKKFINESYTTIDGVELLKDTNNETIKIIGESLSSVLNVDENYDSAEDIVIEVNDKKFIRFYDDNCLDSIIFSLISNKSDLIIEDEEDEIEEDENEDNEFSFSRIGIDRITSDLSFAVISKLIFNETLIGYRFRLKNGCLDISVEKGKELGIVPYKIGKRVTLTQINGVYASNYECKNKVLFPDISGDDELCRELLQIVLS